MKVERINENQVKFILSQTDLTERNIKITDLAYGSEKTQELFSEMMEKAMEECGFQSENTPLVIEAIPMSMDSLIILVTKVATPEALADKLNTVQQEITRQTQQTEHSDCTSEDNITIYAFDCIDDAAAACSRLHNRFVGSDSLYKHNGRYFLLLQGDPEYGLALNKTEAALSEFGQKHISTVIARAYITEHGECLIKSDAIKHLHENFS